MSTLSSKTKKSKRNRGIYITQPSATNCGRFYVGNTMYCIRLSQVNTPKEEWVCKLLPFSKLIFDEKRYKPFYFDTDTIKENLTRKLSRQRLVEDFTEYWLIERKKKCTFEGQIEEDRDYMKRFKSVLMAEELPDDIPPDLERILDALFFLKTGSLAHMGLRNIKEVTNLILSHYKEHAIIYLHGFKQYRHDMNLDNLGSKLSKKAKKICDEVRGYRKMGRPDGQKMEYNVLMRLLFPELENHLR